MRGIGRSRIAAVATVGVLATAGGAWAFQALPHGDQVNNDPAVGIDPARSVSGGNPTNADVVGGALVAGKQAVPWAIFQQETALGSDQIFVRSFAGGAWTTRGNGTVGGRSSGSPAAPASLNFDKETDGEVPAIDFAGAGRAVPWATWYEETSGPEFGLGEKNVFASRFDAASGKWIFGGQGRGTGGGSVPVPSLNIHTYQSAENPSVAGGSAVDPTKPGPWVTWQELSEFGEEVINEEEEEFEEFEEHDQIFVERPEGPGMANCDEVTPSGVEEEGHVPAVGGFCWQQVGVPRYPPPAAEPSLNVDPTREGVEPDIAFTGTEDKVPWVVWYEKESSEIGLRGNEMVFAAKAVKDGVKANGGFHWEVVGTSEKGVLDTNGTNGYGKCAESASNEEKCSLNKNATKDAEDPRVAAGTMNPANPTVPWVVWDETLGETKQIFASRLVEGTHFELANNGAPLSVGANDSTRPDITFSGNTPYVSWRQDIGGGQTRSFYGHFVNAATPTFVPDESTEVAAAADVREPISSGCTANPFNKDGAECQGGALGTPFFLFTNGSPLGLFADAYQPGTLVTDGSSLVTPSSAVVGGAVNPLGASVNVFFEYGTTPAYGAATAAQKTAPEEGTVPFAAILAGLPAGTTIHYRAVAVSDFVKLVGTDQIFTTTRASGPPPPPPPCVNVSAGRASVSGKTARLRVTFKGPAGTSCRVVLRLTVIELLRGHRLVGLSAKAKLKRKVVVVGATSATLAAGQARTVRISLNRTGKRLLARRHRLKARLRVGGVVSRTRTKQVLNQVVTFKAPKKKRRHR